ncbi:cellulose binding domain-containing protein [Streptomyces griseoincarnatus]
MPADRPDGSAALRAALTNPGDPDAACTAASTTSEPWNGGCNGRVTITATGAPVSRWSVTLPLRSSQRVVPVWNGSPSRNGNVMTVRSTWNGSPAAGASTSFGFTVDGSSASPPQIGARTASLPPPPFLLPARTRPRARAGSRAP